MEHNYTQDIPKITGPFEGFASSTTEIKIDETFTEQDGSQLIRSHFWRRIFTTTIRCGESGAFTIIAKTGTSQATLSEVAGSLETSVYVLKADISSKLSVTETLSEENTVQFVRNVAPKPCHAKRFAEWQRKERVTIRIPKGFFRKGFHEHHIDIGATETYPDEYEYYDRDCCQTDFDHDISKGFDEVYTVSFRSYTTALLAKTVFGGKVQFPKISGSFTPGQKLSFEEFRPYLNPSFEIPVSTIGRLSESLGPAKAYYGLPEPEQTQPTHRILPLVFGLASGLLVATLLRSKNEQTVEEDSGHSVRTETALARGKAIGEHEAIGKVKDHVSVQEKEKVAEARAPERTSSY